MVSAWRDVLIKCRYEPRILPYLLALIRLILCTWPQTGYLHPDEFFQSPEVVAGHHYQNQVQYTWEFSTDKPIRCMLIPFLLNRLAFMLVSLVTSKPSAYLLLVAPRLTYTISTFVIDFCLYKLCQYYSSRGLWYLPVSVIFQSSFICLGCLTRTLSNAIETIIFSLLLFVVCQLIRPRFRIIFVTPTRSRPAHEQVKKSTQLTSSIAVGFLLALGTFNRPTFPCFAFVPMLYWIFESFKRNSYNVHLNIHRVLMPLAATFSITSVLISSFDTYYYCQDEPCQVFSQAWQLLVRLDSSQLYEHLTKHWILTPYNFIMYNSNTENLAAHTLHAPYVHMLVNIPLAFNLLGLMFYSKLINLMISSGVYRLLVSTHRVYALMLLAVLTPTILLSFIPHQEFRFLLPIIVPLVYTFAYNIYASNSALSLWLVVNLILTYFYSTVHQSGVTRAALDLDPILKSHQMATTGETRALVDVVAFRCFLVPSYQWNIPRDYELIKFHLDNTHDDLASSVDDKIGLVLDRHRDYLDSNIQSGDYMRHFIYMMLPNVHLESLRDYISQNFAQNMTNLVTIKHYAPHFSGEDFALSMAHLREFGLKYWQDAFGFSLLRAELTSYESNQHFQERN